MGDGYGPQWSNDAIDGWEESHTQLCFMMDGCIMYVMVSFTLLHLYHGFDEDDVSLCLHMYILLSLSYPVTCTMDD